MSIYLSIYLYVYRERESEKEGERETQSARARKGGGTEGVQQRYSGERTEGVGCRDNGDGARVQKPPCPAVPLVRLPRHDNMISGPHAVSTARE